MSRQMYCCGFAFNLTMDRVVLIEKQKPLWMRNKWNGVGGSIEPGETCEQAQVREFTEETGVLTGEKDWRRFCTLHTEVDAFIDFLYMKMPEHELMKVRTVEAETVCVHACTMPIPRSMPNLRWLIPMARSIEEGIDRAAAFIIHEIPKNLG